MVSLHGGLQNGVTTWWPTKWCHYMVAYKMMSLHGGLQNGVTAWWPTNGVTTRWPTK